MNHKKILRYFSKIGKKYLGGHFEPLNDVIKSSNLNFLVDIYIGKMILFSFIAFFATLIGLTTLFFFMGFSPVFSLLAGFASAAIMAAAVIVIFHSYPYHVLRSRRMSIEVNLPFSMNHMAAVASSGISPYLMFKLLSEIKEYREVTNECSRIVRNIDVFGMDVISAIKNVANRTPSEDFRKFLSGIISTVETGGSLVKYLENSSKDALFDYRLKRENYLQRLSTYADIYTAVLIAAPLFFVSVLSIMALVGGQVFGLNIPTALRVGIYGLIPAMNILFLIFIHTTQPTI